MTPNSIREKLRQWVLATGSCSDDDVLVNELCIVDKTNRADLVHANGKLRGFEIKSESDTLQRWSKQRSAYQHVFDEVWICCHRKHASRLLLDRDDQSGIIIIDEFGSLAILRPAKINKSVSSYHLSGFLWRGDVDRLCRTNSLPVYRSEKIKQARERLAAGLPIDIIREEVLRVLKARYKN